VAVGLFVSACGGASSAAETVSPRECEGARVAARDAWRRVAEAAHAGAQPPTDEPPLLAERALARLEAHRDALRAEPREVDGERAFELSSAMMDGIDELTGELPDELRDRADDAAEALLTDRGRDGSLRAADGAVAVLEELVRTARPEAARAEARRAALAELAHRAARAAEAYEADVARGDRYADRARVASLPDPVDPALRAARDEAAASSRAARRACGVSRTLEVPAP
jgi:uncharacterized protein (UPF0147 family)